MVAVAHPEAALLDPELHERALADAARRLGRDLTAGERRIDLVRLDRDLAAGKARLVAAIETERRSAASRYARDVLAGREARIRLRLSPAIRRVLRGLYDAGRAAARSELARAGLDPDHLPRTMAARTPVRLAVIEERLGGRLADLGVDSTHRAAIAVDLSTASRNSIIRAVNRLPGVRAIAADFASVPAFAGLGSVWDEADAAGVTSAWTYSAVMDDGTCETCADLDGTTYGSWDEIQEVLPDGGPNPDCDGGDRCRCRAVPEFGDETDGAAPAEPTPEPVGPSPILDALPEATLPEPAIEAAPVAPGPSLVGPTVADLVPGPTDRFLEQIVDEREYRSKVWAEDELARRGLSRAEIDRLAPEEAKRIVSGLSARIQHLVDEADPRVRVSAEALDGILRDGRWKSQFETQTSGGTLNNELRAAAERNMFGYPDSLPAEDRPIYSYLGAEGVDEETWLHMYGDVVVRLKPEIKARATFTLEDSLGETVVPQAIQGGDPSLAYRWMMEPGHYETANLGELSGAYPEMQVHGGLRLADIAEVRIPEWREPPYWVRRRDAARGLLDILDREIAAGRMTEEDAALGRALEEKELADAESHLVDPYADAERRLRELGIPVVRF